MRNVKILFILLLFLFAIPAYSNEREDTLINFCNEVVTGCKIISIDYPPSAKDTENKIQNAINDINKQEYVVLSIEFKSKLIFIIYGKRYLKLSNNKGR